MNRFLCGAVAIAVVTQAVSGQPPLRIGDNEPNKAGILKAGSSHTWAVTLSKDQHLEFAAESGQGNLVVQVFDKNGTRHPLLPVAKIGRRLVAPGIHGVVGTKVACKSEKELVRGEYTVKVMFQDGKATGNYTFTLVDPVLK